MATGAHPGEREILRELRARTARGRGIRIGIGDDCAVLTPRPGEELLVTTDFSIEGRHFRHDWHQPESIGYKCLARGLSDIAAMGGRPLAVFVSLAVPRALTMPRLQKKNGASTARPGTLAAKRESWIDRFYDGLLALADREHITLAGGDLSESPTLTVADIIVIGAAPKGRALLRSTAQAGDTLYVTGTLGGASAELAALESGTRRRKIAKEDGLHPHFFPQPRLPVGKALLRRRLGTACIDISDGLSVDLMHLCEESGLAAELNVDTIPIGLGASLEQALHGGDDYELLFTARPGTQVPKRLGGVAVRAIGQMIRSKRGAPRISLVDDTGGRRRRSPLQARGWQHF